MTQGPDDTPIDLAGGVARVMGDHGLFARVLDRFRGDYRRVPAAIRAALAVGDSALAQRLAHNLKGASGMIEARALAREAQALEQALGAAGADCGPLLERLDAEFDRVLRQLEAMQAQQAPAAASPVPAGPMLAPAQARAQLAALLDSGDGTALELVRDARAALVQALGEARFGEVAGAVEAFDFERALALLDDTAA